MGCSCSKDSGNAVALDNGNVVKTVSEPPLLRMPLALQVDHSHRSKGHAITNIAAVAPVDDEVEMSPYPDLLVVSPPVVRRKQRGPISGTEFVQSINPLLPRLASSSTFMSSFTGGAVRPQPPDILQPPTPAYSDLESASCNTSISSSFSCASLVSNRSRRSDGERSVTFDASTSATSLISITDGCHAQNIARRRSRKRSLTSSSSSLSNRNSGPAAARVGGATGLPSVVLAVQPHKEQEHRMGSAKAANVAPMPAPPGGAGSMVPPPRRVTRCDAEVAESIWQSWATQPTAALLPSVGVSAASVALQVRDGTSPSVGDATLFELMEEEEGRCYATAATALGSDGKGTHTSTLLLPGVGVSHYGPTGTSSTDQGSKHQSTTSETLSDISSGVHELDEMHEPCPVA